ncbi:MAG: DUF2510 domain-containing protein [Nocardioides sp.]
MTPTAGDSPPAGWYPDPDDREHERYWDGHAWTDHRQPIPAGSASPEETAVLPRAEQPAARSTTTTPTASAPREPKSSSSYGWVAALVGVLVGLVVGATAGVVIANNNDSSTPQHGTSSRPPRSTATETATTTATVTASVTATETATETATVTVTASPSP